MNLKTIRSKLVCSCASKNLAIVKRHCKQTDAFGEIMGGLWVFYDICEYRDGEVGEHLKSFVTFSAAVECLFS